MDIGHQEKVMGGTVWEEDDEFPLGAVQWKLPRNKQAEVPDRLLE